MARSSAMSFMPRTIFSRSLALGAPAASAGLAGRPSLEACCFFSCGGGCGGSGRAQAR
jgi:hypothetical protein